ncbi:MULTISPECIES: TSUP family transporter [Alcaligenes]|uniref:TSUP family transporter n=1 Tax=Alcaligenes TaxID=507 RepID=UPI0009EBE2BD|nr:MULTISPECIES: TSUP family transporter [Alcaligenes]UTM03831.1 sulfite exporter TauE/SafE family protein [Alcaligenes sp. NLF5-7]HRO21293.1 TSUP family transporter [Alcaligenes phenolicus]HRP16125.1 TSUP family transporter [Alcaligenes phenolicus]
MESVYWAVAVGAIVAGFVQGLSGFAFGMVAMSCWAWFLEPQLAAVLAVCGAWTGQMIAAFTRRRTSYWQILLPSIGLVMLAVLIPVLAGARLYVGISQSTFRAIVLSLLTLSGIAMLVSSVPQLLAR